MLRLTPPAWNCSRYGADGSPTHGRYMSKYPQMLWTQSSLKPRELHRFSSSANRFCAHDGACAVSGISSPGQLASPRHSLLGIWLLVRFACELRSNKRSSTAATSSGSATLIPHQVGRRIPAANSLSDPKRVLLKKPLTPRLFKLPSSNFCVAHQRVYVAWRRAARASSR